MNIYLAGCGQIGQQLGAQLQQVGHRVTGLKRQTVTFAFPVLPVDLSDPIAVQNLPKDADIIVFTVTPGSYDERGYQTVYDTILGHVIDWAERHKVPPLVILVSSTGVYGQQNGEWVNEASPTEPDTFSGRWIVFGERQLQHRLTKTLVLRFSGIYGPQRTRLVKKVLSGTPIQQTPPLWTNRIHETDCIGVLRFLIKHYQAGKGLDKVYLVSDDTPVSQYDIYTWIAQQLQQPPPSIKTDNLSQRCNKRCDNSRIKALGYRFQYPTYQSGYTQVLSLFLNNK